jgi:uncharacterized membrane protein YeaQ/YmgE (transglycosylase-associated protein family)
MTFGVYIVLIGLSGVIVGALAPRLLPGRDPIGIVESVAIGVGVSLLGGLIGWYAVHSRIVGFLLAVAVTVGLAYLVRGTRQQSTR